MSIRRVWKTKDIELNDEFIKCCENSRVLAHLLKARGIDTPSKINSFLNPLKCRLSSPDVFLDMEKASVRIKQAIERKEHITVYGDFDADGVTSTALLYLTLKEIGADVGYYLPDRVSESHGLNSKALVQLIAKKKSKLIITVDCGISNKEEVNFANLHKTDIIITDHHEAPEILPNAYAILNPKAMNSINENLSIDEIQSLNYLAGVGVAFKLACKLLEIYNCENFVNEIIPLAAVGTIGDVVELIGENRSIVAMGIELLKNGKHKGIQKLLENSLTGNVITSETIAYSIVPKLNAAGRLESPYTAIKILTSQDDDEIEKAADTLSELNESRQKLCDETFKIAEEDYKLHINEHKKSIILLNDNWHIGVIGIVASKLVEKYNKPVFLMTKDKNTPNIIRCSCRSIKDLNIHLVLSQHEELFEGFGGHKMAAGFSFDENKISFEKFKNLLNSTIEDFSQDIDFSNVIIEADMEIFPEDISAQTVKHINKMQPFGAGNTSPLFIFNGAKLENYKMMGQNNNHLKMFISKNSGTFECIKWNFPNFNIPINSNLDILVSLKTNIFNNSEIVQLIIEDIHSEFSKKDTTDIKILDHRKKENIIMQVFDYISTTKKKTVIFINNHSLINLLKIPEEIQDKIFSVKSIPENVEQIMFFDIPATKEDFINIIDKTTPDTIHLMNFNIGEIEIDNYLLKFSGMLKYALKNLKGIIDITRISNALSVSENTIETTLALLESSGMIDITEIDENTIEISYIHPLELSKLKTNKLFLDVENNIAEVNSFRKFYINSSIEEIKEEILC